LVELAPLTALKPLETKFHRSVSADADYSEVC
jgi:hypothetical protein